MKGRLITENLSLVQVLIQEIYRKDFGQNVQIGHGESIVLSGMAIHVQSSYKF